MAAVPPPPPIGLINVPPPLVPIDFEAVSFVSARGGDDTTDLDRSSIASMQDNGPKLWNGVVPRNAPAPQPRNVGTTQHLCYRIPRGPGQQPDIVCTLDDTHRVATRSIKAMEAYITYYHWCHIHLNVPQYALEGQTIHLLRRRRRVMEAALKATYNTYQKHGRSVEAMENDGATNILSLD